MKITTPQGYTIDISPPLPMSPDHVLITGECGPEQLMTAIKWLKAEGWIDQATGKQIDPVPQEILDI